MRCVVVKRLFYQDDNKKSLFFNVYGDVKDIKIFLSLDLMKCGDRFKLGCNIMSFPDPWSLNRSRFNVGTLVKVVLGSGENVYLVVDETHGDGNRFAPYLNEIVANKLYTHNLVKIDIDDATISKIQKMLNENGVESDHETTIAYIVYVMKYFNLYTIEFMNKLYEYAKNIQIEQELELE